MLVFSATVPPPDLRKFDRLGREAPFAVALSLTRTAQHVQGKTRADLKKKFVIRRAWVPKNIRIRAATKSTLTAQVGSVDRFMALQEMGGQRGPGAVPVLGGGRRRITDVTTPGKWPAALLKKKGHFLAPMGNGNDEFVVWERFGRKRMVTSGKYAGQKRQRLRLIYRFEDDVKITPRWHFGKLARIEIADNFPRQFDTAFGALVEKVAR